MTPKSIPTVKCPICKKPAHTTYRPFCSKRCADVDLGKWFGGHYAVPANEEDLADLPEEFLDGSEEM